MSSPQSKFCLPHAEGAHFEPVQGYRDWLEIRDLGLSDATRGQFDARVARGRVKMYYEGEGEFVLEAGDFVYHPPRHVHDFMQYADDIEIFEPASPADRSAIDV